MKSMLTLFSPEIILLLWAGSWVFGIQGSLVIIIGLSLLIISLILSEIAKRHKYGRKYFVT